MNILQVSSEAVPFAKSGGLGDVLGALPQTMARYNHQLKVFLPQFESVLKYKNKLSYTGIEGTLNINNQPQHYRLNQITTPQNNLTFYFIENNFFYSRASLYIDPATGLDYDDNDDRFIYFNLAVLNAVRQLNWKPDIIHCHDWQSALIPAFVKNNFEDGFFAGSKTVLTIHNLAYQGSFPLESSSKLNLPESYFYAAGQFEYYNRLNFLKGGISLADKITTVSPTYADEIQTEEFGCGLEGVIAERKNDLVGILNGVDYKVWSPQKDKKIEFNYRLSNLSNKQANKVHLLNQAGLPIRERTPLFGVVSRLADQKGFDLFEQIAEKFFSLNLQMILLGTGEDKYHQMFTRLEQKYPDKLKAYLTFDDQLAHQIEAASDIFLMPSRYEPCGLNQIYSLKYGTLPLIRKVGGLSDTVDDINETTFEGTGFVFKDYDSNELFKAVEKALRFYSNQRIWKKIMKQAMKKDFSWDSSAQKYFSLFESL